MKKKPKPDLMERTRAAVAMCTTREYENDSAMKMAAFLDIFHPKMSPKRKHKLIHSSRKGD